MAQDPQRVLQAICQPAQPTAPACMFPMGWQNPPASLITLQPVLHPLDPGYREAVCVAQQENKAAPVIWNWERHAGPSLLALLTSGTKKDTPKHQQWGTREPLTSFHSGCAASAFPSQIFFSTLEYFGLLPTTPLHIKHHMLVPLSQCLPK